MSVANPASNSAPITSPPADTVALFHGLLLVACADGTVDGKRLARLDTYCRTLTDLGQQSFDLLMHETRKVARRYSSLPESVAALGDIASPEARSRLFVLAVDLGLAAGELDSNSEKMLAAMAEVLGIGEEAGAKILAVLRLKHRHDRA